MADQNQTATQTGLPLPPQIPGGREVYDMIMKEIEPDLQSTIVDTLDAKYAGESTEDKQKRMVRYQQAFEKYQAAYKEHCQKRKGDIRVYGHSLLVSVEKSSSGNEEKILQDLESAMTQPN